jgi:hypothetical protein
MQALVFAFFTLFLYNPHQGEPYKVPIELSLAVYEESLNYDNVKPEEVIAMIVAEHGGGYPYSTDSEGKAGEKGLMQISKYWRNKYNKIHGTEYDGFSLLDWKINVKVGVFVIHLMKENHSTKGRCKVKVWDVVQDENGSYRPVKVKQKHNWIAHYRCTYKAREKCETIYRERLIRRFSQWR